MNGKKGKSASLLVRRYAEFDDINAWASFRGGMRYGMTGIANWTAPQVTLDIYEQGLELRPTYRFLRFLVPTWRARYDEISAVRWLGRATPDSSASGPIMVRGVKFDTTDGDWVIFWCRDRDHVLHILAQHGLNIVDRKRLNLFNRDA